jgi:hypothetical protein
MISHQVYFDVLNDNLSVLNKEDAFHCKTGSVFMLLYYFGPSISLSPALLSVENWVPLKPLLGGVGDDALFHYPSRTDSIKPSLQFSSDFAVASASKGSLFPDIYNPYKLIWA